MKNLGGIKMIMVTVLALIILAGTGAAVSLSNSGGGTWKYQREINIKENSGTALTDYQVLIELKGADFPVEAKSDGADIRFTDSNGNELNYWIESWNYAGKSAKVWVKFPSIPAGSTAVVRIFYGNPSANSASSGYKVFEFFDEFEENSLNLNKWDSKGAASVSGGKLQLDAAGESIRSKNMFNRNVALRMNAYFNLADATDWIGFIVENTHTFAIFELQSQNNPSQCGGTNVFNARNYISGDICTPIYGATNTFKIF